MKILNQGTSEGKDIVIIDLSPRHFDYASVSSHKKRGPNTGQILPNYAYY